MAQGYEIVSTMGGGGGGWGYRVFEKKNPEIRKLNPFPIKKNTWAVLTKKVGPFWTGPFRIWAVLTWAVSDLGRFDYNSFMKDKSL